MQQLAREAQREAAVRECCRHRTEATGVVPGIVLGSLYVVHPNSRRGPQLEGTFPVLSCRWRPLPPCLSSLSIECELHQKFLELLGALYCSACVGAADQTEASGIIVVAGGYF